MNERFSRMPRGSVGGLKLLDRLSANKSLSYEQATDPKLFRARLEAHFGPSDSGSDVAFSYAIRDAVTGVAFRAYSAQSGPAYGGMPDECFVDYDGGDFSLRAEVEQTLREFDEWLERT